MNIKKICLYGTESTGKSTLAIMLAEYYQTSYVPEMARDVIQDTRACTMDDLIEVANIQANEILKQIKNANKFLFIDTDLLITRSYGKFLFNQHLNVPKWVEKANIMDLYLYLKKDVSFIQDGTRLEEEKRNELDLFHYRELQTQKKSVEYISGNWTERFEKSVFLINKYFFSKK